MEIHYYDGKELLTHYGKEIEVYHYTSPDNFLSILTYDKLWFSDSQFMNDRSEFVYIKEIFKKAAKDTDIENNDVFADYILGVPYSNIELMPLPKGVKSFFRRHMSTRFYLLCASIDPDSHSLWSYYIKNNHFQGYNIGVSVNSLIKSIANISNPTWKITHGMVNYDSKMQVDQLHKKIIELGKQYETDIQTGMPEDNCIDIYQDDLAEYLIQRCLFFKNPAFAHENEYRFVIEAPAITFNTDSGKSVVDFHVSSSGLIVPHLEVEFDPGEVIRSITLAPMMEREVAKHGVQRLLDNKFSNPKPKIDINFSQIDVRY